MRPGAVTLRCVGVDPFMSRTLVSRLTSPVNDAGEEKPCVRCIDIPQDIRRMSPPTKELERLIRGHKMLHIHNTCARWCFGNARCYVDANENQKLGRRTAIGRIIVVAWGFPGYSHHHAGGRSDYDTRHLREDWGLWTERGSAGNGARRGGERPQICWGCIWSDRSWPKRLFYGRRGAGRRLRVAASGHGGRVPDGLRACGGPVRRKEVRECCAMRHAAARGRWKYGACRGRTSTKNSGRSFLSGGPCMTRHPGAERLSPGSGGPTDSCATTSA